MTFDTVPPLVNAPASASNPTSSPTQRTACSSTSVAAAAHAARLTSKQEASRSPRTPISSPDEPTKAKNRGRGCARLRSSTVAASSRTSKAGVGSSGKPLLDEAAHEIVDRRLPGPEVVEAAPGIGDDRGGAVEQLFARRVEAERSVSGAVGSLTDATGGSCTQRLDGARRTRGWGLRRAHA